MNHQKISKEFLKDKEYASWHDKALWYVREKRDQATKVLGEYEDLREEAKRIKEHTIEHLGYYLEEFEKNATKNGIKIHYAKDSYEHNKIAYQIIKDANAKKVVKSKSMLTEECGLNHYLENLGIEVIDTDLGERIVQLRGEAPTHIVLPAIHLKKEQIAKLFEEKLGAKKGKSDPKYLTNLARESLREKFLEADVAMTGVNFAISQSGSIVVCTNEGNADLGVSLAKVHIASMGIEKVIPTISDLGVFTRLLARSATGQAITTYTSHFNAPQKGKEFHIIIVDNGRSKIIKDKTHKNSLHCIRCGACLNTCPIYRRSGGKSYSYTIPGPIGSILANTKDNKNQADLAFASTLCGSCTDVCPVKIDIHSQLLSFRKEYISSHESWYKKIFYTLLYKILSNQRLYTIFLKLYYHLYPLIKYIGWGEGRDIPKPAKKSFKEIYRSRYEK